MPPELDADDIAFAHQMFELARNGETKRLSSYVDAGLPVNLTNSKGDTLLILAAYHSHAETVRALLDRGADHARINDNGQTALAAAAFRQSADIVRALLDAGADPALGPRSALVIAEFFDLPEMRALLQAAAQPSSSEG
jgi:uncharacterized protein